MNPLVKRAFKQLNQSMRELDAILDENKEQIQKQKDDREEALKETWRRSKEIAVLEHGRLEYEELAAERKQLAENQKNLSEHLKRLLAYTKALNSELRT